jgi:hypothetical protein
MRQTVNPPKVADFSLVHDHGVQERDQVIKDRTILRHLNAHKLALVALGILITGMFLVMLPHLIQSDGAWKAIVEHLGLVFVPSGLMALVYEVMLRRTFLDEIREQFSMSLGEHFRTIDRLHGAGVKDVHEALPDAVINAKLENASRSISILQTWIPNLLQIERSLAKAIERRCRVRILLLDPESAHADARNADLGYIDRNTIRHSIELNLKQLVCFHAEVGDTFEVRLYSGTPVLSIYACDDTRFLGFYWRKRRSSQGPQFEVHGGASLMGLEADRHFEDLWTDSRPVDFAALSASSRLVTSAHAE